MSVFLLSLWRAISPITLVRGSSRSEVIRGGRNALLDPNDKVNKGCGLMFCASAAAALGNGAQSSRTGSATEPSEWDVYCYNTESEGSQKEPPPEHDSNKVAEWCAYVAHLAWYVITLWNKLFYGFLYSARHHHHSHISGNSSFGREEEEIGCVQFIISLPSVYCLPINGSLSHSHSAVFIRVAKFILTKGALGGGFCLCYEVTNCEEIKRRLKQTVTILDCAG